MSEGVVNIPIGQIYENPNNVMNYANNDIENIADSIKIKGFVGSIDVVKNEGGKYTIVDGARRYKAAVESGLKEIPCKICTVSNDVSPVAFTVNRNVMRKESFFRRIRRIFNCLFGKNR